MTEREDALLNDLLDGRLSGDEASALRARLEAEPELGERFEELQRVQAFVREQGRAAFADAEVPAGFLAGVHARIDDDASQNPTSGDSAADPTSADLTSSAPSGDGASAQSVAKPRGRLLRFMAVGYAAAAAVVLGLAIHWVTGDRDEKRAVETVDDETARDEIDKSVGDGAVTLDGRKKDTVDQDGRAPEALNKLEEQRASRSEKKAGDLSTAPKPPEAWSGERNQPATPGGGRFKGPHGSVPPSLREPGDEPAKAKKPKSRAGSLPDDEGALSDDEGTPSGGRQRSPTAPAPGAATGPVPAPRAGRSSPPPASAPAAERAELGSKRGRRDDGDEAAPDESKFDQRATGEIVYLFVAEDAAGAGAQLESLIAQVRAEGKDADKLRARSKDKNAREKAPARSGGAGTGGSRAGGVGTGGVGVGGGAGAPAPKDAEDAKPGTSDGTPALFRLDGAQGRRLRALLDELPAADAFEKEGAEKSGADPAAENDDAEEDDSEEDDASAPATPSTPSAPGFGASEPAGKHKAPKPVSAALSRDVIVTLTQAQWKRLEALVRTDDAGAVEVLARRDNKPQSVPSRRGGRSPPKGAPTARPGADDAGEVDGLAAAKKRTGDVRVRVRILIVK